MFQPVEIPLHGVSLERGGALTIRGEGRGAKVWSLVL